MFVLRLRRKYIISIHLLFSSTDANSGSKIAGELISWLSKSACSKKFTASAVTVLKTCSSWITIICNTFDWHKCTHEHTFCQLVCNKYSSAHRHVKSIKWSVYIIQFNKMTCMEKWEKSVYKADLRQLPCWILWLTKHLSTQYLVLMFRQKHNNSRLVEDNLTCQWIMLLWLCEGNIYIYYALTRREREREGEREQYIRRIRYIICIL